MHVERIYYLPDTYKHIAIYYVNTLHREGCAANSSTNDVGLHSYIFTKWHNELPYYHQVISFVSEDSTYNTNYVNRIMNILCSPCKYIKPCSIIYKLFKSMRGGLDILFFWRTVCLAFSCQKSKYICYFSSHYMYVLLLQEWG
jgi:hypothetical protein